jgi:hypothetical protein
MADSFYTDNMTVNEILNLSNEQISKLNERDVSRALRTVSLAANKRVQRLMQQARKTKDGYVPKKSAKRNIAVDALNAVTNDGKTKVKFGVKSAPTRNKMIEQIGEIRRFMNMQTSTVSGAVKVRKEREKRLFGKTAEQAGRGKTKKEKKEIEKKFSQKVSDAYALFRKYLEYEGLPNSPYMKFAGSDSILNLIGKKIINGDSEEETLQAAINEAESQYIKEQEEWTEATGGDFWEYFGE